MNEEILLHMVQENGNILDTYGVETNRWVSGRMLSDALAGRMLGKRTRGPKKKDTADLKR